MRKMLRHTFPDQATRHRSIGLLLCGLTLIGLGLLQLVPVTRAAGARRGLSSITNVTPFAAATFTQTDSLPMPANNPYSAVIDTANGFAYFGGYGAINKIRLSDFMLVGTLLLNRGEDALSSALIDTANGFAYFGTDTRPGRIVKVRLSDFTRVGALTLNPGEDSLASSVIDLSNGFAYFGTNTSPGHIVKVRLSDFTRVGALALNPGEDSLASAVIDAANGSAYFGTDTEPGNVVKVRLSDFTRSGATFVQNVDNFKSAVIDPAAGFAYFGAKTVTIIKVRLSDLTIVGILPYTSANTSGHANTAPMPDAPAIPIPPGAAYLTSAVIDTVNGFAYFGATYSLGVLIKVRLADFSRVDALPGLGSEGRSLSSAVIDPANGFAYLGASPVDVTYPSAIHKVRLAGLQLIASITLSGARTDFRSALIDAANGYAYFGTGDLPAAIVRVRLSDFSYVDALTLNDVDGFLTRAAVIDTFNGYAYFATSVYAAPSKIIKLRLSDFTRVGELVFNNGEDLNSAVIDSASGFAYFTTGGTPGKISKIRLSDFSLAATLTLNTGENFFATSTVIDTANGYAYIVTNQPSVVKVRLSDFTRVGSLPLGIQQAVVSGLIDATRGFAYFGFTDFGDVPSNQIIKVSLSDFTIAGVLSLNLPVYLEPAAVIDEVAGYGYFGSSYPNQVLKVRLSDLVLTNVIAVESCSQIIGGLSSAVLDPLNGYAYFGKQCIPVASILRIDLAQLNVASTSIRTARTGDVLTYTYTIANASPLTATSVVLTSTLATGQTLNAVSPSCKPSSGLVVCTLGNLISGTSTQITIQATVTTTATKALLNTTDVTSSEPRFNSPNHTATSIVIANPLQVFFPLAFK